MIEHTEFQKRLKSTLMNNETLTVKEKESVKTFENGFIYKQSKTEIKEEK